jgi:putative restriction endonuclease
MTPGRQLEPGAIYTRDELRKMFGIVDATLNTGVFRLKGAKSIWLFVTKNKTKDRTPYKDRFEGDLLYWQGQLAGRTDAAVIEHEAAGDELLVFYRDNRYEHPGAGFRFEGGFRYLRHSGSGPTSFVLERLVHITVA